MHVQSPFFDSSGLPPSQDAYVAWLDVMGVRSWMLRSLPVTANFIFKLHVAAIEAKQPQMTLYPVMDGVYVVSPDLHEVRTFLCTVFTRLAYLFNSTAQHEHRFLMKSAVAYGPVIHGSGIAASASAALTTAPRYRDSVLMGMPMVFAHQSEALAPPFGIFIHESAHQLLTPQERKRSHRWWPWFIPGSSVEAQSLKKQLPPYFAWCEARAGAIDYDLGRIQIHKVLAEQYLVDA